MEGAEGCDGTYFDAKQAVEAGIIPAENVIKTSKQVCTKVKDSIKGVEEACAIQEIMASINTELGDIKPLDNSSSIPNQNQINNSISKNMDKEQEFAFGSVCAQLGLDKSSEVSAVINRVTALMDAEKKVKDVQSQYDALKIEKAGVDAQLVNAKKELADANAKLKTYQDAEKAQHDAEVAKFIEDAIADGKITAESKETWVAMAATNFEVVKATLNSIEKRDKITDKIATDPANVNDAANAMTEAEKKMAEAVDNVVGKDFEFKTLD
jgi:hypothetical protein